MDLLAYTRIGDEEIEEIVKRNGIEVPRLRGYELCSEMTPWTKEEMNHELKWIAVNTCKDLCQSNPFWNPNSNCHTFSSWTDYLCDYYLIKGIKANGYEDYVDINWNRIHGWKRKVLKTAIHNNQMEFKKFVEKWNSYCGRKDVLRVHSRIGGNNWSYFKGNELKKKPWFIEKIDDWFDCTYCDIYCKIQ